MMTPKINNLQFRGEFRTPKTVFSVGNSKLSKGVLIFNLLAIYSCPNCDSCAKACYAKKAQVQYPSVFNKRLFLTQLAVNDLDTLKNLIMSELTRTTKKIVRIHESGDFVSQKYLDMWVSIAKEFPLIRFYTYTKTRNIWDFSQADKVENLNIIDSHLPDGSINFGNSDYISEKTKKYPNIKICPATRGGGKIKCMQDCKFCLTEKKMLFLQH